MLSIICGILADLVAVLHFLFILVVVFGGLAVLRWRRLVWFHVPAVAWGAWIEFVGWGCPLTPLENWLRRSGNLADYETGFIEHYLLPIIYPAGLTRNIQLILGSLVILINLLIYAFFFRQRKKAPSR